jgi:hypothetical protein
LFPGATAASKVAANADWHNDNTNGTHHMVSFIWFSTAT